MLTNSMRAIALSSLIFIAFFCGTYAAHATVQSWTKDADGVTFTLDVGTMKLRICGADIVEVKYTILPRLAQKLSLVVNSRFDPQAPFTVSEAGGAVLITTSRLHITVDKATNAVTYADAAGKTILAEDPKDNKSMHRAIVATSISTYTCATSFVSPA